MATVCSFGSKPSTYWDNQQLNRIKDCNSHCLHRKVSTQPFCLPSSHRAASRRAEQPLAGAELFPALLPRVPESSPSTPHHREAQVARADVQGHKALPALPRASSPSKPHRIPKAAAFATSTPHSNPQSNPHRCIYQQLYRCCVSDHQTPLSSPRSWEA